MRVARPVVIHDLKNDTAGQDPPCHHKDSQTSLLLNAHLEKPERPAGVSGSFTRDAALRRRE